MSQRSSFTKALVWTTRGAVDNRLPRAKKAISNISNTKGEGRIGYTTASSAI